MCPGRSFGFSPRLIRYIDLPWGLSHGCGFFGGLLLIGFVADIGWRDDHKSRDRIVGTAFGMSAALGPHQTGIHEQTGRLVVHGGMDDSAHGVNFVLS